jgi:hypothetical protein
VDEVEIVERKLLRRGEGNGLGWQAYREMEKELYRLRQEMRCMIYC